MNPDVTIDALGVLCPEPLLRAKAALARMKAGQRLVIVADDPLAEVDFRVFCQRTGHELVAVENEPQQQRFTIRKKPGSPPA